MSKFLWRNIYFYYRDHLGTSTYLTDANGQPYQMFMNKPFGETLVEQHSLTEDYETPYKFNGKELDAETGLYYYGARYYDARTSIWLSVDPMANNTPNFNPYVYCEQNPVNLIDPDGKEDMSPKDHYLINKNGTIDKLETNDKFDDFYIQTGDASYTPILKLNKNKNGLLAIPDSFQSDQYNFGFKYTGSKSENYISGEAMAGLLGALRDSEICDLSLNHWSNSDGSSPSPSVSHKDGTVGDLKPLSKDNSGNRRLITDKLFDAERSAELIASLRKFGWTSVLSEKNPTTKYLTPGTTHYSGHYNKKGKWIPVRHNNHFHIQKYKPKITYYERVD